jgi:hypothetical protein
MRSPRSGFGVHGSAVGAALAALLLAGCGPASPDKDFQAGWPR